MPLTDEELDHAGPVADMSDNKPPADFMKLVNLATFSDGDLFSFAGMLLFLRSEHAHFVAAYAFAVRAARLDGEDRMDPEAFLPAYEALWAHAAPPIHIQHLEDEARLYGDLWLN
jgi:hypothetical protein